MATNPFFNNFNNTDEQNLIDSLVAEAITIAGMDIFYLPRHLVSVDEILGEDRNASFNSYYQIEMAIKTVDNFEGDGDMMSKFGFSVKDSMTLTVSNTRFNETIGQTEGFSRPREGDLIFFPLNKKLFEIRHVEHESVFYAMGKLYQTDMKLELFEFSSESFNTGIEEIDSIAERYNFSGSTVETIEELDKGATNHTIETEGVKIIDYSEHNIFGSDQF